jgi:hypothetical protein
MSYDVGDTSAQRDLTGRPGLGPSPGEAWQMLRMISARRVMTLICAGGQGGRRPGGQTLFGRGMARTAVSPRALFLGLAAVCRCLAPGRAWASLSGAKPGMILS